jgi:hypothetical protein
MMVSVRSGEDALQKMPPHSGAAFRTSVQFTNSGTEPSRLVTAPPRNAAWFSRNVQRSRSGLAWLRQHIPPAAPGEELDFSATFLMVGDAPLR